MSTPPVTRLKRLTRDAYRVGWFCPLQVELQAAIHMLDEAHEKLPLPSTDPNVYYYGAINEHNIVIAGFPETGNCSAATTVTHMQSSFPNLTYGLLVGIGGGVPTESDAGMIRLGHVVVSKPTGIHSGAVNYSHGKAKDGIFERTGTINKPPVALLSAAMSLDNVDRILKKPRLARKYRHPGIARDHMNRTGSVSLGEDHSRRSSDAVVLGATCEHGDGSIEYGAQGTEILVHRGTIASGELLLRDAALRDELAKEHDVLCFEMEAAGALTGFPCLVIRGISDYCDSLKNNEWHGFASAAAAAYARELFFHLSRRTESIPKHSHFIVPFTRNRNFVGREALLETLRHELHSDDGPRRLAITGLGGTGKTQVALQMAFWVKHNLPDWSVFWLPAYSLNAFDKACNEVVSEVGIELKATNGDPKEAVKQYLRSREAGKWLLILDNADDSHTVFPSKESPGISLYLPANDNGRVLFTSRFRKLATELVGTNIHELGKMSPAEATTFFEISFRTYDVQPFGPVQDLLLELEHLPLAISQAAAYLSNNHISVSIKDYLAMLRGPDEEAFALLSRDSGVNFDPRIFMHFSGRRLSGAGNLLHLEQ